MEDTLSQAERQLIVDICAQYGTWSGDEQRAPQLIEVLAGGRSNHAVRLRGNRDYVLRLGTANPPNDVCRLREQQAHGAAAAAGLAPTIRFADVEAGILLTDYVAPCPSLNLEKIAALLRGIHALPVIGTPLFLEDRLHYWDARRGARSPTSALLAQVPDTHDQLRAAAADLDRELRDGLAVLCHNDLLAANRRTSGGRMVAIDWEYARAGHAFFDLAVCASELPAADREVLLELYLQRPATTDDRHKLLATSGIYAVIAASWYECHLPQDDAAITNTALGDLSEHLAMVNRDA